MARNTPESVWSKLDRSGGEDACWPFIGTPTGRGYGQMDISGVRWATHRLAYTVAIGPIPPGEGVLHSCDNPPCGNPRHLFLGDQKVNMRDAKAKGRLDVVSEAQREYLATPESREVARASARKGWTEHRDKYLAAFARRRRPARKESR